MNNIDDSYRPVEQVSSAPSSSNNYDSDFEISNACESENNNHDIPDYDQPNVQPISNTVELELSDSIKSVNQPITCFKQVISISRPHQKAIVEQQPNQLIYDQTTRCFSREDYTRTTISNIPSLDTF